MKTDLSILIVNWNTKVCLRDCLQSINDTVGKTVNHEIIVVDNASTDSSSKMIKIEFSKVKLLENKANIGFGRACNQAAKLSNGKYLLILNPDIKIIEADFKELFGLFKEKNNIGAIVPIVLNNDGSPTYTSKRTILSPVEAFNYIYRDRSWRLPTYRTIQSLNFTEIQDQDYPSGLCFLIPAFIFKKLGGFDESFFLFFEDTDFGVRLTRKNLKTISYPAFRVKHHGGKSTSQDVHKRDLSLHRSAVYFFRKTYGIKSYMLIKLLLISGAILDTAYISLKYLLRRLSTEDFRILFRGSLKILKWHIMNPVI